MPGFMDPLGELPSSAENSDSDFDEADIPENLRATLHVKQKPAAEVKPGSGVSKSIFEKDFAEPAGGAGATFSYEELKKPIDQLPGGVDPRRREQYLSDADFERILGMARDKFDALKKWRQNEIKRKAALF